ncbi:MAG: 50S ribosomal protein L32 [Candidatus Omnitrophica bacterium]|nr:50S ribosomal protein L32 [Candidatus Omnitrophota bacterium]
MAHPKRQHSKQRSRKRRTHQKLSAVGKLSPEGNPMGFSHRVCPTTGFYKGEQVLEVKKKTKEEA